ncbi:MAG: HAMP domain-containing sensor histidine kinase [Eubacteriales bacterium]|nr:HAMP domain-containing sensor histidine kinase [Eubacteriales bacterium]
MVIAAFLCIAAALGVVLWDRRKQNRILKNLEGMLERAMDGSFTESDFSESRYSALETRLARYLQASELSGRRLAKEKDKIKTLIADISHQTKTPISNILLYGELLGELEQEPEGRRYLESLQQQAEKLRFLIEALVKLSRLETGILAVRPKSGDLSALVREAVAQYRERAGEKGLFLEMEGEETIALFDEKWTNEALCNLLDNAVKYTEQGGITVRIRPYELYSCIEVRDTGKGIPEEEHARIFSRFYRTQDNETQEGVGIGLYLARQILSEEGGYIKVASKVGEGSVFSMYLPRSVR